MSDQYWEGVLPISIGQDLVSDAYRGRVLLCLINIGEGVLPISIWEGVLPINIGEDLVFDKYR